MVVGDGTTDSGAVAAAAQLFIGHESSDAFFAYEANKRVHTGRTEF